MRFLPLAGLLALSITLTAQAQQPSKVPVTAAGTAPAGAVLKSDAGAAERMVLRLAKPGSTIVAKFEAEMGLYGFIVSSGPDRNVIVYTDKAGSYMVTGQIFSGAGKNMTQAAMEQYNAYLPKMDYAPMFAAAGKTGYVEEGTGGGVLYAIADANCIYCKRLYDALREPVKNGHLRVRWIMAAILGDTSAPKAAELLALKGDRKLLDEALASLMSTGSAQMPSLPSRLKPSADKISDAKVVVEKNNKFLSDFGVNGTPMVIYAKKGGGIEAVPGMPRPDKLAEIIRDAAE